MARQVAVAAGLIITIWRDSWLRQLLKCASMLLLSNAPALARKPRLASRRGCWPRMARVEGPSHERGVIPTLLAWPPWVLK